MAKQISQNPRRPEGKQETAYFDFEILWREDVWFSTVSCVYGEACELRQAGV